jgi:hypothetical protein
VLSRDQVGAKMPCELLEVCAKEDKRQAAHMKISLCCLTESISHGGRDCRRRPHRLPAPAAAATGDRIGVARRPRPPRATAFCSKLQPVFSLIDKLALEANGETCASRCVWVCFSRKFFLTRVRFEIMMSGVSDRIGDRRRRPHRLER